MIEPGSSEETECTECTKYINMNEKIINDFVLYNILIWLTEKFSLGGSQMTCLSHSGQVPKPLDHQGHLSVIVLNPKDLRTEQWALTVQHQRFSPKIPYDLS